jgi:SAM-dependent methyltransferase
MFSRKAKSKATSPAPSIDGFFDDYPRFFETSETSPSRSRLNLRHRAIFEGRSDAFAGARVLDIASHDGRWSFAALQAGAAHVTGVEPRPDLVESAGETLASYGVATDRYRMICGDVFDVLGDEPLDVDVVLCLGFLYHTSRYTELLHGIAGLRPRHVVVDSQVSPRRTKPVVVLRLDRDERQREAYGDPFCPPGVTVVGDPSVPAIELLLDTYGFQVADRVDWKRLAPAGAGGIGDYLQGRRVTLHCRPAGG